MNSKGQGLLETTIAIGIVITGLVGAISLVNYTIRSTTSTVNRLIALNLAWEGSEVAVNIRDSNYLAGVPFNTDLDGGADDTAIFTFDEGANAWLVDFGPNSLSDNATIFYLQGGMYRQGTPAPAGSPTQFRRLLVLDNSVPGQVRVVSSVQWDERGDLKLVSSERILYDWR